MALPPRERAFVYASIDLQVEREKKALRRRKKYPEIPARRPCRRADRPVDRAKVFQYNKKEPKGENWKG